MIAQIATMMEIDFCAGSGLGPEMDVRRWRGKGGCVCLPWCSGQGSGRW